MKKMIAALTVAAVLAGGMWILPTRQVKAAPIMDPAGAQQLVDDFAPWVSAVILQKPNIANRLFPMERGALAAVQSNEVVQMYARFPKLDDVPLSLAGMHSLGDHIGTAFFTAATQDGPIGFKVYYYRYGTEMRIGKVEMATHWTDLEALSQTVDTLATPVTAMLQSRPQ